MFKRTVITALILTVGATAAHADLLGYWNFNASDFTKNGGLATANASLTTTVSNISWFSGDLQNALNGDASGVAFSPVGNAMNGQSITIQLSGTGVAFSNIAVSYATRGTSTGFSNNSWAYSTNGTTFTNLAGSTYDQRDTVFTVRSFDFTPLTNAQNVWLRLTFDGASGASGNNRIDNLQINGTANPVPEPISCAVLGIGVAALIRRRRD